MTYEELPRAPMRKITVALDIPATRCISKFTPDFRPDIAIDDIQETNLGNINLIVREK